MAKISVYRKCGPSPSASFDPVHTIVSSEHISNTNQMVKEFENWLESGVGKEGAYILVRDTQATTVEVKRQKEFSVKFVGEE